MVGLVILANQVLRNISLVDLRLEFGLVTFEVSHCSVPLCTVSLTVLFELVTSQTETKSGVQAIVFLGIFSVSTGVPFLAVVVLNRELSLRRVSKFSFSCKQILG